MQTKKQEKIWYETEDKIDYFSLIDDETDSEILKYANFRELEEVLGKKHFALNIQTESTKSSSWAFQLETGFVFIISLNKDFNKIEVSKNISKDEVDTFFEEIVLKLSKINMEKESSQTILKEIEKTFGESLFNLNNKEHINYLADLSNIGSGKFALSACEVLKKIPNWWQSYPPPVIIDREVFFDIYKSEDITIEQLSDSKESMEIRPDVTIEMIINPDGRIVNWDCRIKSESSFLDKEKEKSRCLNIVYNTLLENNLIEVNYNK